MIREHRAKYRNYTHNFLFGVISPLVGVISICIIIMVSYDDIHHKSNFT